MGAIDSACHSTGQFLGYRLELFALAGSFSWIIGYTKRTITHLLFGSQRLHLIFILLSAGIFMVGNLGREKGVFWHCLLAAYLTYPIRYIIYDESYWLTFTLVASALVFDYWSKDFDRAPKKRRSLKKRFFYLSVGVCIYLSVWVAFFYFNGKISDGDGEEIPVHEALHNFFASSWWTDMKQTLYDIYQYAQHHGWYEIYKQIIESLDVDGEQKAYKVIRFKVQP